MKKKITRPIKSSQTPATAQMLDHMEERLCHRMDAGFNRLRSEIHEVKSEIHEMKSEMHGMKSELHRVALLVEEQNARNKYVMDGYAQIYDLLTVRRES